MGLCAHWLERQVFYDCILFISGPRPDWDPDIVEALDEDFDFDNPDNQLDDDFIQMANAEYDGDEADEGWAIIFTVYYFKSTRNIGF